MKTRTQWFYSPKKPTHIGAYEVSEWVPSSKPDRFSLVEKFAWWDGKRWSVPHFTAAGAMGCAGFFTPHQNRIWRGLAVKPKSGISSPTYRPNEQNAAQTEQPSLSDAQELAEFKKSPFIMQAGFSTEWDSNIEAFKLSSTYDAWLGWQARALLSSQSSDKDADK